MEGQGGEIDTGVLFREAHRRCWRADAPPLELEPREVLALMPLLIRTGSVGLVWPRLRHRAAALGATGAGLEAAYQSQVEHNARVEREIARVVGHLQGHGIDPVLIKGWAVSRLYPEGLVRPAGDIDLVVPDEAYERAKALLAGTRLSLHRDRGPKPAPDEGNALEIRSAVDLHAFSRWDGVSHRSFFADVERVPVGETTVLVPRPEDHLRALCLHFLRHGAVRPMRLCDIALLQERRPPEFDWTRCMTGTRRQPELVETTMRLAHHVLGASLDGAPVSTAALPPWLLSSVDRQWVVNPVPPAPALIQLLSNPRSAITVLRQRWPDPVTATMRTGARFDEAPRLPIQWAAFIGRIGRFVASGLPRQAAERMHFKRTGGGPR